MAASISNVVPHREKAMDIKHIKNLLDIFEGTVEKRCAIYEIADDEDDENRAAAECNAAKNKLILAIEQLIEAHDQLALQQKTKL